MKNLFLEERFAFLFISETRCTENAIAIKNVKDKKYNNIIMTLKSDVNKINASNGNDSLILETILRDHSSKSETNSNSFGNSQLTQDKITVLKLTVQNSALLKLKDPEMIIIVENIWEHTKLQGIIKDDHISKVKAQTALISFA